MTQKELIASFESILPEDGAQDRMLRRILSHQQPKHKGFSLYASVAAALVVLCAAAFGASMLWKPVPTTESVASSMEMSIAEVVNQFEFKGKTYTKLTAELCSEYGLSKTVSQKDVGTALGTIQTSPDDTLTGQTVYSYQPTNAPAIVVVRQSGVLERYAFMGFLSYENNSDEDASAYLDVYGIHSTDDIARIEVYSFPSATSKVLSRTLASKEELTSFYNGFSSLKNTSDAYFSALGIENSPPQESSLAEISSFSTSENSIASSDTTRSFSVLSNSAMDSPSYEGSAAHALEDSIDLRIVSKNGLYFDMPYYPHIGFLSRYQIQGDFLTFLTSLVS